MRVICDGHSKTPIEFLYLETKAQPLTHIISTRRIMYLHHILQKQETELVKRVYKAQKESPTKGDFVKLVEMDLKMIDVKFDEEAIKAESKSSFKKYIKSKMCEVSSNT